jgi:hypothetical protein
MSSVSNRGSIRKRRLIRGIALLFLIYTAIDIASPELCRGETLGDCGQESIVVDGPRLIDELSSTVSLIEAGDNQPTNEPPQQPSGDDDCCFCCCAHVLPGTVIANLGVTDVRSSVTSTQSLSVPSPPLTPEFHPPRSA